MSKLGLTIFLGWLLMPLFSMVLRLIELAI